MHKHLAGQGGALCRLVANLHLHMFELSALGRGRGDFAATARAGLVVSDEVGRQVQLARHRAVRKGKRLQPPPVLEVWPVLALPPIHWEIYILIVEECDKQLPFVGHSYHAGEHHHL